MNQNPELSNNSEPNSGGDAWSEAMKDVPAFGQNQSESMDDGRVGEDEAWDMAHAEKPHRDNINNIQNANRLDNDETLSAELYDQPEEKVEQFMESAQEGREFIQDRRKKKTIRGIFGRPSDGDITPKEAAAAIKEEQNAAEQAAEQASQQYRSNNGETA